MKRTSSIFGCAVLVLPPTFWHGVDEKKERPLSKWVEKRLFFLAGARITSNSSSLSIVLFIDSTTLTAAHLFGLGAPILTVPAFWQENICNFRGLSVINDRDLCCRLNEALKDASTLR